MKLTIIDHLPLGILEQTADKLFQILLGPTLINIKGLKTEAIFISVLLHGNEITGWDAVRSLLKEYQNKSLHRSICLFIGNIQAAKENKRVLSHQLDYNRAWNKPSIEDELLTEQQIMQAVITEVKKHPLFASIDIHNNTGLNPHYACINIQQNQFYHLALLFSPTIVYFIQPDSVQSMAFSKLCPAVTLECGQSGEAEGINHVKQYLQKVLNLDYLSGSDIAAESINLYHTMGIVKIPENISFSFIGQGNQINFHKDLESYNFKPIEANTIWAETTAEYHKLQVFDEAGVDVFDYYFSIKNGILKNKKAFMPAMITLNEEIIRQDCLCYIMEKIHI
ncbi:MAG: M14 family metallopeptidase [Pseudomonadota bacterium]